WILEQLQRGGAALRGLETQMQVGSTRDHAPARGAHQKSLLDQERLGDILERAALVADRRRKTVDTDRAAVKALDDRREELAVQGVESLTVHLEQVERGVRDRLIDAPVGANLRIVAHPPQQAVGDARGAARALRDAPCAAFIDGYTQDGGGALHDTLQV